MQICYLGCAPSVCIRPMVWELLTTMSCQSSQTHTCFQVRALAAVYGLEPRACGRRGQTLFRTSNAGLPTADGQAQVYTQTLAVCTIYMSAARPTRLAVLQPHKGMCLCCPHIIESRICKACTKSTQKKCDLPHLEQLGRDRNTAETCVCLCTALVMQCSCL